MRVRLLEPESPFAMDSRLPWNASDLDRDLALGPVFRAMAGDDATIDRVARAVVLGAAADSPVTVRHRQAVLADARANPGLVRELYRLADRAVGSSSGRRSGLNARRAGVRLQSATELLERYLDALAVMQGVAERYRQSVNSRGLTELLETLCVAVTPDGLRAMRTLLQDASLQNGVMVAAGLGPGNRIADASLRRPPSGTMSGFRRLMGRGRRGIDHRIDDHDTHGRRALRELRDAQLQPLAESLARTAHDVRVFLEQLRRELAFYVGALNLADALAARAVPTAVPEVRLAQEGCWRVQELVDLALVLTGSQPVVGNDVIADGCRVVVITGANGGGKSTFLRSIGQCQLMAQVGLFVGATSATVSASRGVFSHFRREEDSSLRSGKLDDELRRLSAIADAAAPGSLVLSNESCAATNQREGSAILSDIAAAFRDHGVRAFYVTHLSEFAAALCQPEAGDVLSLRAERASDGGRSFRIRPGEPADSSHGLDFRRGLFNARATE